MSNTLSLGQFQQASASLKIFEVILSEDVLNTYYAELRDAHYDIGAYLSRQVSYFQNIPYADKAPRLLKNLQVAFCLEISGLNSAYQFYITHYNPEEKVYYGFNKFHQKKTKIALTANDLKKSGYTLSNFIPTTYQNI